LSIAGKKRKMTVVFNFTGPPQRQAPSSSEGRSASVEISPESKRSFSKFFCAAGEFVHLNSVFSASPVRGSRAKKDKKRLKAMLQEKAAKKKTPTRRKYDCCLSTRIICVQALFFC
jgi:hypothetical protein